MCEVWTSCQGRDKKVDFGKRRTYQIIQSVEVVLDLAFEALFSLLLMHCALRRVQVETFKAPGPTRMPELQRKN